MKFLGLFLDVMSMLQTQNSGDAFVNKLRATKTSYVVTISNELTLYPSVLNSSASSPISTPFDATGSKLFFAGRLFLLSFCANLETLTTFWAGRCGCMVKSVFTALSRRPSLGLSPSSASAGKPKSSLFSGLSVLFSTWAFWIILFYI